jgi:hypothetical protein
LETTKRTILTSAEIRDLPGHYKITVTVEGDDDREWSVIRKPDGTYWEYMGCDIFPRSGGILRVDIGDQIVDKKALALCEENYKQVRESLAAKLRVLGLIKVSNTDPQQYELRLHDSENKKPGYVWTTEYGTEDEIRAMLKNGGMTPGQIDLYLSRA